MREDVGFVPVPLQSCISNLLKFKVLDQERYSSFAARQSGDVFKNLGERFLDFVVFKNPRVNIRNLHHFREPKDVVVKLCSSD